jgi:hypothetical protein
VCGTFDYLHLNKLRWEASRELRMKGVPSLAINTCFEVNCWNEGIVSQWFDISHLQNYDYLIQYGKENNFEVIGEIPFRRTFPFKWDTLRVMKKIKSE